MTGGKPYRWRLEKRCAAGLYFISPPAAEIKHGLLNIFFQTVFFLLFIVLKLSIRLSTLMPTTFSSKRSTKLVIAELTESARYQAKRFVTVCQNRRQRSEGAPQRRLQALGGRQATQRCSSLHASYNYRTYSPLHVSPIC